MQPSSQPSMQPSSQPSVQPTGQPSRQPSCQPTSVPSPKPTMPPTKSPSATQSVQLSQGIDGVSFAEANTTAFQTAYISSMAIIVETTADEIRITDIVETDRRKLTNDGTGVEITAAFTRMTLEADEVAVMVASGKSDLGASLVFAGYDAVVVFATAVTISDPTATPTPSPTLLPSTIATVDSKTGGPSDAVLIGAIIGAVVGVVVIILMVLCCIRCLKSNKPVEDKEIGTNENVDVEEVDVKEVEISVLDCNSSEVTNPPL